MYSHILTVEKIEPDMKSIEWKETGTCVLAGSFPALKNAKVGQKYRLTYKGDHMWSEIISVERVS